MALDKKTVAEAVAIALADGKGKRKFTQSVDLAINFRDVDFKKPENKLNIEYMYAFVGTSGRNAIVVFRTQNVDEAIGALQKKGVRILTGEELHSL